jgi:hypothetical protein
MCDPLTLFYLVSVETGHYRKLNLERMDIWHFLKTSKLVEWNDGEPTLTDLGTQAVHFAAKKADELV